MLCAALLAPAAALADRVAQANVVFRDACARCHDLDALRATVASSAAADNARPRAHGQPSRLSVWLRSPSKLTPETHCESGRLDVVQRDLLESFLLRQRDLRANVRAQVAPASRTELVPKKKPVEPSRGQGDHR